MNKLLLCSIAGFVIAFAGCDDMQGVTDENGDILGDNNEAIGTNDGLTGEELEPGDVEDAEAPVGQQVTLRGDVSDIYDAHTFDLSDEGIDFEKDLVVVTKEPLPFTAEEDATVEVTGTVAKFSIIEVESEYGWDFDPEVEVELEDVKYYLQNATVSVIESQE